MRRTLVAGMLTVCCLVAQGQPDAWKDDPVLSSMAAEIERAKALENIAKDKPYFIEHVLYEGNQWNFAATLGALVNTTQSDFRMPEIQVRVGSYDFDQSNYVRGITTAQIGGFPLENVPPVMRHQLWLGTDLAFKMGLETLARKRAALENVTLTEQLPDFSPVQPMVLLTQGTRRPVDETQWTERLKRLSNVFRGFPSLQRSSVRLQDNHNVFYLANNEGTRLRLVEPIRMLTAQLETQAADGMRVRNSAGYYRREGDFPADAELTATMQALGKSVAELAQAPLGEAYVGPVLFEGEASAQMFAQLLGENLVLRRNPVPEPGRNFPMPDSELSGRKGLRVLPDWINVEDDPTRSQWDSQPLIGHYAADLEGVAPKPLKVVEKGVLKEFLLTRQPVKDFRQSNGRARLPGAFGTRQAAFSNLIVQATETVSREKLREQFLTLLKDRGREWGVIVRKLDYPSMAPPSELRALLSPGGSSGSPFSPPLMAYKVYADGREELFRGMKFRSLAARNLRDLVAAAEGSVVFSFLNSGAPLAASFGARFVAESSVVAPSAVLLEEAELERLEIPLPNLPLVEAPPL